MTWMLPKLSNLLTAPQVLQLPGTISDMQDFQQSSL